jgi:hypothetical protein
MSIISYGKDTNMDPLCSAIARESSGILQNKFADLPRPAYQLRIGTDQHPNVQSTY